MLLRDVLLVVACAVLACACANKTIVSGRPQTAVEKKGEMAIDWQPFSCSRGKLFDGALRIAQRYNLRVDTLEKDSGFIEFKLGQLGVNELTLYTRFPLVSPYEGYALGSYREFVEHYQTEPTGSVDLTFLMTPKENGTTELAIRSHWIARDPGSQTKVSSSGYFEDQLVTELARETGCPMVGRWSRAAQNKLGRLRELGEESLLDGDDYWVARSALLRGSDDED